MYNSVIVAYRGRPQCLQTFLRSIELALKNAEKNSVEVIITELGTQDERTKPIIDEYKSRIHIKYFPIQYFGNFWKTKALNHSARFAEGEIITMVDVDALVPPVFFNGIERFFGKYGDKSRLSHRVRFLDPKASKWFRNHPQFTENQFNKLCIAQAVKHKVAKERYTVRNLQAHELHPAAIQGLPADFRQTQVLGNSHFSIKKEHYMKIGGYDERFIGYGCEDLDFNARSLKVIGQSRMNLQPSHTVYHLEHVYEKNKWQDRGLLANNRKRYKKNMGLNDPTLPITSQWGKFQT